MNKDEALKLALEALEMFCEDGAILHPIETRKAIKEALVQDALDRKAENARELGLDYEPVAFASHGVVNWIADKQFQHEADLYTTPQRTWVGLTDKELNVIGSQWHFNLLDDKDKTDLFEFARTIEAKLKEKNT